MTTPPSGTSNASAYPSNPGNGTNTFQQCIGKLDGTLPEKLPAGFDFSGNVRTYYVAAEEKLWDYAPTGWDNWLGVPFNDSVRAMNAGYVQVGTQWVKALYRGYTDETFNQETEQPPTQGIQGPLLRAEVGDMVQILFYNKLTEKYASMHSMGLLYGKPNEGSDYPNTTTGGQPSFSQQEAVPPGGCVVYKWLVGEEQTPPPGEASALFAYHSFVNFMSDVNAGLVGPQIVYNRGNMSKTMASTREFPILYNIYNEASSFLAATNAELKGTNYSSDVVTLPYTYPGNESFWIPELVNMPTAQLSASEAPPFHTLNGYVFSNGPAFEMCEGDDVTCKSCPYIPQPALNNP